MKSTCFAYTDTDGQNPLNHVDSILSFKNLNFVRIKSITLCIAGMLFLLNPVFPQIPEITWEKAFSVNASHYFSDVQELTGGNFVVLGAIDQPGEPGYDIWLLELNSSGDTIKTKIFKSTGNDVPMRLLAFGTGGYLLAFLNETGEKDYRSRLIAVDHDFKELWSVDAEKHPMVVRSDVAADNSGNIWWINTVPGPEGKPEVAFSRLDAEGNVLKEFAYSDNNPCEAYAIRSLPDGTVAMSFRMLPPSEKSFIQVVRIDNEGEVLWRAAIPDANKELTPQCLCCAPDNALLVGGWAGMCYNPDALAQDQIWDYDFLLSKIDPSGKVLWTQNYNREGSEKGTAVAVMPNGQIMAAGKCETSFTGSIGPWLLLVDKNGKKINDQVYKFKFVKDQVSRIIGTKDGGLLMIGPGYVETDTPMTGWLRKLNPVL